MVCKINSLGLFGIDGFLVDVEADLSHGLPSFDLVGLPDTAVKESKDRVRTAIKNCGFALPPRKTVINLAPGNIRKEGPIYDLPIILSLLCATDALSQQACEEYAFLGEVSLDGRLRPLTGTLALTVTALQHGIRKLVLPLQNANEAALIEGMEVYGVSDLAQLVAHLKGEQPLTPYPFHSPAPDALEEQLDFSDLKGQYQVKRAMQIAAAGFHNVLLIGSPGSGKSMAARRLPTILPPMSREELLDSTKIHSVAGLCNEQHPLLQSRPFRSPHHTVSAVGLAGGGQTPRPGEISLAHNGVLFLDELPEFSKDALEVLRQPLEDHTVTITRAAATLTYPCNFMLVCAMNPCRCGYFGHPTRECTCSASSVANYRARISGPLLDRIDLHVEVPPVTFEALNDKRPAQSSAEMAQAVHLARQMQQQRYTNEPFSFNAQLPPSRLAQYCPLEEPANTALQAAFDRLNLSARAYDRIVKVARTIADLEQSEAISRAHILEAISYRSLDRKYWQK